MPVLEVDLLGPPLVRSQGEEISLAGRKSGALLYYLAAHPARPFSRGQLVALLWEEHGEAEGRNNLSTALSRLRHSLAKLPFFPIRSTGDSLWWDATLDVQTDLDQFNQLAPESSDIDDWHGMEAAANLYRGPFLDGFEVRDSAGYDEWLRLEREQWQQRILTTYRHLIAHYESHGELDAAILAAQRALAIDQVQEQLHQTLMRLFYIRGDRTSSLAQFLACERLLKETLDVNPTAETRALRNAIATGRLPRSLPGTMVDESLLARDVAPTFSSRRPRYPLIGREAELQQLWRSIESVPGQQSPLIVIQGEAGIGKTRLVEEIVGRLSEASPGPSGTRPATSRWTILLGHSYQDAQGLPYHPIIEAFRSQPSLLRGETQDLPDIWLAEVNRLLPEIGARRPHLPAPARLDPQQERRRLFEGIARLLTTLRPPRLFILEDLHWADDETLHLLAYLVRHTSLRETLFLASVRAEELGEHLEQILTSLEYEGRLSRLVLPPLTAQTTAALVRAVVRDQADELAEHSFRETEGNPLFTIELVRSLLEADAWQPKRHGVLLEGVALPPTVQAVIRGRLARLDAASREFLNSAAVFRRAFDFDEIRTVAGQTEEVALGALETLLRTHILRETVMPVAAGVVATRYRFSHDQIRRVVCESLSDARRRLLHRRVFDALVPAGDRQAEELAYHASQGQSWLVSLDWSERAAINAVNLSAYASAVHLFEQALACASQVPPTVELRQRTIDLRLKLAQVAFYVEPGRLMEWLAPAEVEASSLDDTARLAQTYLAEASAVYIQGQFTIALPRLEQVQAMAESAADVLLRARADNILGRLLVIRGEFGRGIEALESALAAAEPASGPTWPASPLERLVSLGLVACAHAFRGEFAKADQTLARFAQLPTGSNDATARAAESFYRELIAQTRGDWTATAAFAHEAIMSARAAANIIYEYVSHAYLGPALAHLGRVAEGLEVQRMALALAERAQTRVILGRVHAGLADLLLLAGDAEKAYETARVGETLSDEQGYLLEAALCARSRGEACASLGAWAEAVECLARAQHNLASIEAWPDWARVEAAFGRLYLSQGNRDQARSHFERASEHFAAMGMQWDFAQARDALTACSGQATTAGD